MVRGDIYLPLYYIYIYIERERFGQPMAALLLAPAEGWGALGGYSVYGIGYIGYIKRFITIYYRYFALI